MCRWFAYISATEPCLIEDVLVTPNHSLSKQIHEHYLPKLLSHDPAVHAEPTTEAEITERNRLFNVDGFGMAYYSDAHSKFSHGLGNVTLYPACYKSIQPPLHDSNFRSLAANTYSNVLFAHIRAATSTAITPTNNHPFTFGIHTIMHNGYISSFSKIKRKMCQEMTQEAYEHIEGGTDTEHIAALLMSYLCPDEPDLKQAQPTADDEKIPKAWGLYHTPTEIQSALERTISTIIKIQQENFGQAAEPNDLNIAVTDGRSFVACRVRNHPTEQPPSLYYSTTAGATLNRQFPDHPSGPAGPNGPNKKEGKHMEDHGKHVIVASEPTTYKDKEWTLIEKNRIVLVDSSGNIQVEEMK
ncbi:N-terminal nucleophile aminohydrolase, partial [Mollisia scopiformis]